jgi:segregation and condensation protein A
MDLSQLTTTYQDILVRARKRTTVLRKETVSISDKIMEFSSRLSVGRLTELKELLSPIASRPETVVTFLASLELSRLKKMRLHQEGTYNPIFLELLEALQSFDMTLASGFDSEIEKNLTAIADGTSTSQSPMLHPYAETATV